MSRSPEKSVATKNDQIIYFVTNARKPLAFSKIGGETGFVKSACHRVLALLPHEKLVNCDKANRSYGAGSQTRDRARTTWQNSVIQQVASYPMSDLSKSSCHRIS